MYTVPVSGSIPEVTQAGRVRAFEYMNGGWAQRGAPFLATLPAPKMYFGKDVALSADGYVLAAGAPYDAQIGSVGVYEFDDTVWGLTPGGNITGQTKSDQFGMSVALAAAGNRIVIGAPLGDTSAALVDTGKAQAFEFQSSASGWSLQLEDVASNFGANDDPEFTFTFQGTAPTAAAGRTFTVEVLFPGCVLGAPSDNSVAPVVARGSVAAAQSFRFTPQLTVDTAAVTSSSLYVDTGDGQGQIAYCLRVELYDGTDRKDFKEIDMNVQLDMAQGFEVKDFKTVNRIDNSRLDVRETALFNYTLDLNFCDEFGVTIPSDDTRPVAPGELVSICIASKDGEGATIVDVQSVSFENFRARLAAVELIDTSGTVLDETTTKDCGDGSCRVAAITVPRLYEYVDANGNIVDVSDGVYMTGTAVYDFDRRRQLQEGDSSGSQKTTFSIKLNLATPPDRSNESSARTTRNGLVAVVVAGMASALALLM